MVCAAVAIIATAHSYTTETIKAQRLNEPATAMTNYDKRLFTTSKSFDMIASLQYFDKIKDEPQFRPLAADSIFISRLRRVNENVTAS